MRNVKTWGILFLCLLLLPGVAYAQKRQIEGTVISQEDKEPLSDRYRKREPVGSGDRSRRTFHAGS